MQAQVGVVGVGGDLVQASRWRCARRQSRCCGRRRGRSARPARRERRRPASRVVALVPSAGQFRCGEPGVEYRSVGGSVASPYPCSSSHGRSGYLHFTVPLGPSWGRAGLTWGSDRVDRALVDIPSESRDEALIADEVETALRAQTTGFEIVRNGNAVLARTSLGRPSRVLLAGHLDTVPVAGNLPSRFGRRGAARLRHRGHEIRRRGLPASGRHGRRAGATTSPLVMYDCEEIDSAATVSAASSASCRTGWPPTSRSWASPPAGFIEAGCQGTLRVVVSASGTRAHSARSWLGDNAIHKLGAVLDRLAAYQARRVEIDGCEYREGLSAVRIERRRGWQRDSRRGLGDGQLPLRPRSLGGAALRARARGVRRAGRQLELTDAAAGALPGLSQPAAKALVEAAGGQVRAKYGWTDVSRFAALGIPAVNFGPGRPESGAPQRRARGCGRYHRGGGDAAPLLERVAWCSTTCYTWADGQDYRPARTAQ